MPPKLAVSGVIGTPEPAQPSSISPQLPIKACPMRRCSRGNLCAPCFAGLQKFAKTVRVKLVHDSYDLEYFARFIGYGKRVDTRASPPKDIKSPVARELARRILSALATAEYPPALISLSIFCDQGMLDHEKDLGRAIEFAKRGAELGLADIESPRSVSVDQVSDTAFAIKTYFSYQADMESFGDRDIFGCIIFLERLHRLIKTVRGGPNDMKQLRHLLCVSSSNLAEVLIWQEKAHANLDISKARFDAYQRVIDSGSTTEEDQIRIADALFNQGCYCMEGFGGILSNPFKANELWLKAAKMGHLRACKNVATSFLLGDGLPKDEEKWKEWIDKAAQGEEARKVLWGAELEDRQKTFKVLDWMVANGKARGPSRIENKLKDLVKRSQSSSAAEIAWILGADPTTPLLQLSQRALEASQRYHRLSSNLEIFGGHVKPIKEAGVEKEPLFAKVQCVSCRRTAGEAGLERIKRCSGCKSAAVAYCSAECQNTDFLGKNGVHGVRLQRRDRVTECKRNAAAIATFRT